MGGVRTGHVMRFCPDNDEIRCVRTIAVERVSFVFPSELHTNSQFYLFRDVLTCERNKCEAYQSETGVF